VLRKAAEVVDSESFRESQNSVNQDDIHGDESYQGSVIPGR
jgi:hypothetical protein